MPTDQTALLRVEQGASLDEQLQARGEFDEYVTGFSSTDSLVGAIWRATAGPTSPMPVTPTCTWIDPTQGAFKYHLFPVDTLSLPPGSYTTSVWVPRPPDSISVMRGELVVLAGSRAYSPAPASPVAGPAPVDLELLPILYCSDEDIAVRCGPDFAALLPDSQLLARGNDGVFSVSDPWTLTSASNNFAAQLPLAYVRYAANQPDQLGFVVHLRRPASQFPAGGHFMAISAVAGNSVTLRRLHLAGGMGFAPAPATGLAGVEFQIGTFLPQVEAASYGLNLNYNIDYTLPQRQPTSLKDIRPLRRACVIRVLMDRYSDESRIAASNYKYKYDLLAAELDEVMATLQLRWITAFDDQPVLSFFSTRLVR